MLAKSYLSMYVALRLSDFVTLYVIVSRQNSEQCKGYTKAVETK